MPHYVYLCAGCGQPVRQFRMSDDRDAEEFHDGCGGVLNREASPGGASVLIPGHFQKHTHTTGLASEIGGQPDVLPKRRWNNPFGV